VSESEACQRRSQTLRHRQRPASSALGQRDDVVPHRPLDRDSSVPLIYVGLLQAQDLAAPKPGIAAEQDRRVEVCLLAVGLVQALVLVEVEEVEVGVADLEELHFRLLHQQLGIDRIAKDPAQHPEDDGEAACYGWRRSTFLEALLMHKLGRGLRLERQPDAPK
jgi:hypothetical protein